MQAHKADVIGDIHGYAEPLRKLLLKLGYQKKPFGAWSHPEGRFVVFLGDFVDRGPQIRETIHIARSLCDTGNGFAVMGNHEHNAICMETRDPAGKPLRDHTPKNIEKTEETRQAFASQGGEWKSHLEWFKTLPFTLDFGSLRAVHACWDSKAVEILQGKSLTDPELLQVSRKNNSPIGRSIMRLLNGPELNMPPGMMLPDKEGHLRNEVRVRWWNMHKGMTLGECIFPKPQHDITKSIEQRHLNQIRLYGDDEPLVCFGHYWCDPKVENTQIRNNLVCLDLSIAKGGQIACLRHSMGIGNQPHLIVTQKA